MADNIDFFKFLLDISTNIFLELDAKSRVIFASAKAGYVIHEAHPEGKTLAELLPPAAALLLENHLHNVLYQNYPETFSFEFQSRFYNVFMYPFEQNAALCIEDITERRQLSHHLHQTRQRMDFAEKTARLGYWELDLNAKKFYWSAEMYRIFGVNAAQVSVKKNLIREQLFKEDLPLYKQKISELLHSGRPVEGRVGLHRRNGTIAQCLFKAGLLIDSRGERIAGTFQDITPLAEIQQALELARNQAESSNVAKSYFLAQASHDLRQPMQALNMFIAALAEDKLTPGQTEILGKITASAENLKSLLDNLLDISRLDSGGMDFEPQQFDIAELLQRLCSEFRPLAEARSIKFDCRLHSAIIRSDPLLIERIIRNLVSNAFKYAKSHIILRCTSVRENIKITVLDNGVGIQPEEICRIFDEFYQCRNMPGNRRSGAGLGLNIVKKIAGIIDAKVTVRSLPERYTAFNITLHQ